MIDLTVLIDIINVVYGTFLRISYAVGCGFGAMLTAPETLIAPSTF